MSITETLDKGRRIDAITINFSEVFDVVSHDLLLRKLQYTGIDIRVLKRIGEIL